MTPMRRLIGRLYLARPRARFTRPGLYYWTGRRNVRLVPLPRRRRQPWEPR